MNIPSVACTSFDPTKSIRDPNWAGNSLGDPIHYWLICEVPMSPLQTWMMKLERSKTQPAICASERTIMVLFGKVLLLTALSLPNGNAMPCQVTPISASTSGPLANGNSLGAFLPESSSLAQPSSFGKPRAEHQAGKRCHAVGSKKGECEQSGPIKVRRAWWRPGESESKQLRRIPVSNWVGS